MMETEKEGKTMETFRRYEKKYLLSDVQYEAFLKKIAAHVQADRYHQTRIHSIYYDTDNCELIRRSLEKPEYKEKLRIRSYGEPGENDRVFVEFKKKLDGVVYKRRTKALYREVLNDIGSCHFKDEQIGKEILYALHYYGKLQPKIYIGCTRTSYIGKEDDIRITFDQDIRYRTSALALREDEKDRSVTDRTVMELKVRNAMPLWLTAALSETQAYPQGFSKVGNAFLKELKGE